MKLSGNVLGVVYCLCYYLPNPHVTPAAVRNRWWWCRGRSRPQLTRLIMTRGRERLTRSRSDLVLAVLYVSRVASVSVDRLVLGARFTRCVRAGPRTARVLMDLHLRIGAPAVTCTVIASIRSREEKLVVLVMIRSARLSSSSGQEEEAGTEEGGKEAEEEDPQGVGRAVIGIGRR